MKALSVLIHEQEVEIRNLYRYDFSQGTNAAILAMDESLATAYVMTMFNYSMKQAIKLVRHVKDGKSVATFIP